MISRGACQKKGLLLGCKKQMDITFLGHSSFRIKGRTASLITDPFDPEMVGLKYSPAEADIVTVSHEHKDHNQVSLVKGVKKVVAGVGEYEIMGVSIIGLPSFHDDKKGALRGKNTIYIIETDGFRVAHLGDIGCELSEGEVEAIGDIDILILPVGGEYTVGPSGAAAIVRAIEPTLVIPMHYQMPGLRPETFAKLLPLEPFLKEVGVTSETLPKLVVKKEELGEEQKVIILEKK